MSYDFNDAEPQRGGAAIPDNTIVPVQLNIRPGGSGEEGWLKRSKAGDSFALDCEFTITEGEYARRKFWTLMTVDGETEGQKKAGQITRSRLRAVLESARGINPNDTSETAQAARQVENYGSFDGMRFWGVVGYEPATDQYKEKNTLKAVLTPDRKGWTKLEQVVQAPAAKPAAAQAKPAATSGARPSWA